MNIIILKCFILFLYLIKKSSQTSNLKNYDDYSNVYLNSFELHSRKGDYEDYEARLSIPVQYIQKQNSPGDNSYGIGKTTKQDRPPSEKCSKMGTKIVNLLNDYRKGLKLSTLALDDDLCFIAKMHVLANKARYRGGGGELTHDWDPPPASPTPSIKWDQMRFDPEILSKLIGYSGNIAGENAAVGAKTAKQVIDMWKVYPGHNGLMVSSGSWNDMKSQGAGADCDISETYLCYLWIGDGEVKKPKGPTIEGSGYGFESSSRKEDYEDYEARLSVPMQYIQKQNSPGDNSHGISRTTKQDRPASEKCSKMGTEIVNLLNDYRKGLKLSTLALDDDLCFVAKMHVLANKARHRGGGGKLTHDWDPPPASPTPSIKWDQMKFDPEIPSKLIGYSGNIAGENAIVGAKTAKQVIDLWKACPDHNDLMVSSGSWKDMKSKGAGADCDISETYLCYLWIGDGEVKKAIDPTIDGSGSGNSPEGPSHKGSIQEGSGSGNKKLEGSGNSSDGSRLGGSSQEGSGYENVRFSPNGFPLKGFPFEGYLPKGFSPKGYFPAGSSPSKRDAPPEFLPQGSAPPGSLPHSSVTSGF